MVRAAVRSEDTRGMVPEPHPNVDPDQVHLIVSRLELDIIIDALRSVGNQEFAERFEAILRR